MPASPALPYKISLGLSLAALACYSIALGMRGWMMGEAEGYHMTFGLWDIGADSPSSASYKIAIKRVGDFDSDGKHALDFIFFHKGPIRMDEVPKVIWPFLFEERSQLHAIRGCLFAAIAMCVVSVAMVGVANSRQATWHNSTLFVLPAMNFISLVLGFAAFLLSTKFWAPAAHYLKLLFPATGINPWYCSWLCLVAMVLTLMSIFTTFLAARYAIKQAKKKADAEKGKQEDEEEEEDPLLGAGFNPMGGVQGMFGGMQGQMFGGVPAFPFFGQGAPRPVPGAMPGQYTPQQVAMAQQQQHAMMMQQQQQQMLLAQQQQQMAQQRRPF